MTGLSGAAADDQAVRPGTAPGREGFRLDLDLCTGCGACAVACAIENELDWGTSWRWIETFNAERAPGLPVHHLSLACNHCADAPCKERCPALAYHRDPISGAVLLDPERCIGCRYCTWACPYDAPRYDADAGVVSKCTFCHHRQVEGLTPACVSQCPTGALSWGDMDALEGEGAVPGFPRTDADPSIRFVPRADGDAGPEQAEVLSALAVVPPPRAPESATSLASEWPLVAFTLLVPSLVGLMVTVQGRALLSLPVFVGLAALAAAASMLHLGRKLRAWRAVLNLRRSWLSREVALFGAFVAASTAVLAFAETALAPAAAPGWLVGAAAASGVAALVAMDRVYAVTRTRGLGLHSARALLTGVLVAGLAGGMPAIWLVTLGLKVALYVARKRSLAERGRDVRRGWGAVRLGASAAGAALLTAGGPGLPTADPGVYMVALLLLAAGEVVDRCEFYLELEIPTPSDQMEKDLEAARAGWATSSP